MSSARLDAVLREFHVSSYIDQASEVALVRAIASKQTLSTVQASPERLPRLGFLYESQGVSTFKHWMGRRDDEDLETIVRSHFLKSYACWRSLISLLDTADVSVNYPRISEFAIELVRSELRGEPLHPELTLAFRVAVTGIAGNRSAETRLELKRFSLQPISPPSSWRDRVVENVFTAFTRLVRKDNGWEDVEYGLTQINELRELQREYENTYLDGQGDVPEQTIAAVELVGLYHLAQLITLTGEYLQDGRDSTTQVNVRLDRHHERSVDALQASRKPLFVHMADLLWVGCRELVQNAIWTHIAGLGEEIRRFAELLTAHGRSRPMIELWPSQQRALRSNLLDQYRRAILVEMPTSAGKTLLAKFVIVQTKALSKHGTIVYVVPTRALVNQVTLDLRADFRDMGFRVEQAVPAYELDPTEERLLAEAPDILVTTPEKLDLLVRRNHPVTRNLTLVIADEAHNIREEDRGPRLELLLGTIKREKVGARFLLLSPFLPNSSELVQWLGEDRHLPPIRVDWRPGRRLVGAVNATGRGRRRALVFETLPAAENTDVREGMVIPIGPGTLLSGRKGIGSLSRAIVQAMRDRGSILILCRGAGTAMTRAQEIAEDLPLIGMTPQIEAVCRYLEAETGRRSSLIECIRHGVAYHHAGMSHEARWLIERLIGYGAVRVVCGTTTLAQGVNFPITTVIVETLQKGNNDLTYQDFWNIAGRAGRTLVDTFGVVAFPAPNPRKQAEYKDFLRGEAQEISSQLATLIERADEITGRFDLDMLRDLPQLRALFQFLAHSTRVAGDASMADEVEDILRASLVYHQARRQSEEAVRRLVRLCRSYLEHIRGQSGLLTLADQTGFTTPSVLELLREKHRNPEFSRVASWLPDRLFGEDLAPLSERVEAIAGLPEMQLGQGTSQPFNAERIAAIIRDWVRGESLDQMTHRYLVSDEADPDKRTSIFSRYLFSDLLGRASWGIGALEGICLAGQDQQQWEEVGYIPSMIFFGVQRKEAIWLRMVGVPRIVADGLASLWQRQQMGEPGSYENIRQWVTGLTDPEWHQAIPREASLTPEDIRLIWQEFAG